MCRRSEVMRSFITGLNKTLWHHLLHIWLVVVFSDIFFRAREKTRLFGSMTCLFEMMATVIALRPRLSHLCCFFCFFYRFGDWDTEQKAETFCLIARWQVALSLLCTHCLTFASHNVLLVVRCLAFDDRLASPLAPFLASSLSDQWDSLVISRIAAVYPGLWVLVA